MAGRQSLPRQSIIVAAGAALSLLLVWHASPATAASNPQVDCADVADATLDLPIHELKLVPVNHDIDARGPDDPDASDRSDTLSESHALVPRVKAVLRAVFKDSNPPVAEATPAAADISKPDDADSDKLPGMNTRVPGVSDDELARYKRHMYRTDI